MTEADYLAWTQCLRPNMVFLFLRILEYSTMLLHL